MRPAPAPPIPLKSDQRGSLRPAKMPSGGPKLEGARTPVRLSQNHSLLTLPKRKGLPQAGSGPLETLQILLLIAWPPTGEWWASPPSCREARAGAYRYRAVRSRGCTRRVHGRGRSLPARRQSDLKGTGAPGPPRPLARNCPSTAEAEASPPRDPRQSHGHRVQPPLPPEWWLRRSRCPHRGRIGDRRQSRTTRQTTG